MRFLCNTITCNTLTRFHCRRKLLIIHLVKHWIGKLGEDPDLPRRYRYPVTASTEAGEIDLPLKGIHLLSMSADYDTLALSDEFLRIRDELVALDELYNYADPHWNQGGNQLAADEIGAYITGAHR